MNPNDDITNDVLAARKSRKEKDPRFIAAMREAERFAAEDEAASQAAASQAPAAAPSPAAAPAPAKAQDEGPGFFSEAYRAVVGGVRDAANETINLVDEAATWLDNNIINLRYGTEDFGNVGTLVVPEGVAPKSQVGTALPEDVLPTVEKNESLGGGIARSLTQFLVPFVGTLKALGKAKTVAGGVAKAMGAGAVSDFAAFDPHEKRLSNLIMEFTDSDPAVGKAVFEYLAADEGDTAMEGRLKNALEGAGLGVVAEGIFKGIRGARSYIKSRGAENAADAVVRTADKAEPALKLEINGTAADEAERAAEAPAKAPRTPNEADPEPVRTLADEIEARRAAGEQPAQAPRTPDPDESMPALPVDPAREAAERLDRVVTGLSERAADSARRAWIDPADLTVSFTRERPVGALDLDTRVKAALEAAPAARSAEDLIVLRAYRQAQEAAFPGLIRAESVGSGRALDDALRADVLRASRPLPTPTGASAVDDATRREIREDAAKAAGSAARAERRAAMDERALRETAEDEVRRVLENAAQIGRVAQQAGKGGQIILKEGGFVSPSVLMHLASAGTGAAAGAATADDDATWAERLNRAGLGALAGMGVKAALGKAAKTVKEVSGALAAKRAADDAAVESLVRPLVQGIAPRPAGVVMPKKSPSFRADKIERMVDALRAGKAADIAATLDEADFNLANLDTAQDVDDVINAFSAAFEKETAVATKGVEPLAMTHELAKDIGATPESLLDLYRGTDNLAAKVTAHRALLAGSAEKVTGLARHVITNPDDLDSILAMRKQVAIHAAIQARMKGVQTEVARALSSFRIQASSVDLLADERAALIDALGGLKANREFARKLGQIADPRLVNRVTERGALARTHDALFEGWVNGILSGLGTHVVNIVGNSMVGLFSVAEKGIAAVYGSLRHGDDAIRAADTVESLRGMLEGAKDALFINAAGRGELHEAARLYATGDIHGAERIVAESHNLGGAWKAGATLTPQLDKPMAASMERLVERGPAISSGAFNLREDSFLGHIADYAGSAIRTPSRMLVTSDEFFKTALYRGEIRAQAARMARMEGLEGAEYVARVASLLDNPTPELSKMALDAARRGTFTTPLGEIGAHITAIADKVPGLRFIIPFIRTPVNIIKYVGERTPGLNLMSSQVRADIAAGGARRDMVLARMTMGGTLFALAGLLKSQGLITGGGDKQRSAERLAGQQQYSLKVGNEYFSFNRLDPVGMFLGLTADLMDLSGQVSDSEMDDLAAAALLAVQRNLVSRSYVKGMMDLLLAAGNPEIYGEKFVQRFAGSWVPSWMAQFARQGDPAIKEVWSITDAVKSRIPGWSKEVPPHVNLIGEDVTFGDGLGPDIASPVRVQGDNPSPLAQEVARLNLDLKHPARTLSTGAGSEGIDLEPWQYHRLMKLAGARFKELGERLVTSGSYGNLPETDDPSSKDYTNARQFILRNLWQTSLAEARGRLLQEDKPLQRKYRRVQENRARVLQGLPALPVNEN